ncbi:MAG: hypothetical protein WBN92_00645 [Terriglobia bacterium]
MSKSLISILLGFGIALTASADPCLQSPGVGQGEKRPAPSSPALTHNAAIEAALQVKRATLSVANNSAQPSGASRVSLDIELQNNSRQVITAFHYQLRLRFADGRTAPSEGSEDLIKNLAIARMQPEIASPSLTFSPNTTRQITRNFAVRSGGTIPLSVEVFPSLVVFEDRTAIGDPGEIEKAAASRKAEAEYLAGLIADLTNVAASKDPASALASRIDRLRKEGPSAPQAQRIKDLEGFSDVVGLFGKINNGHDIGKEAFQGQLDEMRAQQKMLAEHSSLKRGE